MIKCKYYVYLLKSESSNRTYVGYTNTTPFQRLRKHNGEITGGAKKTQKGRPWKIVMFVTGFEHEKTAHQYEFCIQKTKRYKKRGPGIRNQMYKMKSLLKKQNKICSDAPETKDLKLAFFFMKKEYMDMWKEIL